MPGNQLLTPEVVEPSLLTPMYTTHRHAFRLVEMRRRTIMLQFSVFNAVDLPLYDVMAADDATSFEIQAACDHELGMNGLALKFEGGGHPGMWLLSQFTDAKAGAALWAAPPGRNDYFRTGS